MLQKGQTQCKCGKSVKTLDDIDKNGHISLVGKGLIPHYFCNKCGIDWGKLTLGTNKPQPKPKPEPKPKPKPEPITKVIYRKFSNGDIIALFPEVPGTNNPGTCQSYMHVGQHGSADTDITLSTKLARPDEYAALHKELTEIVGYNLKIVKKFTFKHYAARDHAIVKILTKKPNTL